MQCRAYTTINRRGIAYTTINKEKWEYLRGKRNMQPDATTHTIEMISSWFPRESECLCNRGECRRVCVYYFGEKGILIQLRWRVDGDCTVGGISAL